MKATKRTRIISASLFVALFFSCIYFSSCSLKYSEETHTENTTPEFIFSKAEYTQYKDNKPSLQLKADSLEQYESDGAMFGEGVSFQTWNKNNELETEGSCGLLDSDTKNNMYTMFNNITIKSHSHNIEIFADNMRWNGKTEQLTTGKTDKVTIKRDDIQIEGRGFSASGVTRSFSFSEPVSGSIETDTEKTSEEPAK